MQIKAIAPWFGSKRTLAPRVIELLGRHRVYWEPFCGSMAVILAKPAVKNETVNDLHGDLVNLARVVQDRRLAEDLYARLQRTLFAEPIFRDSLEKLSRRPREATHDIERAYHYFVVSWMGMSGIAGTARVGSSFCRRFTSTGGDPAVRFVGAVESIPSWHERLRQVVILSQCGIDLCERIEDRKGTLIYADPPYLASTRAGGAYRHDFAGFGDQAGDHERLAAALRRFKRTRVVVSYYDSPAIAELYPGWEKIPVTVAKNLTNAGKKAEGRTDAPEVLIVNHAVSDSQGGLFDGD